MSGIAVKFGVPVWKIVYDNQLKDKNQIVPGQALLLLEVDEGQAEESTQPELAKGKTIGGSSFFLNLTHCTTSLFSTITA